MHHPTDRIAHTTAFVTPVVERETAQWVLPMKDRSDHPSHHEGTLLPWSYISLPLLTASADGAMGRRTHSAISRSNDWCDKGRGMSYPLSGVMHIKYPLLLIEKSSTCSGESEFPLSLSEWSFSIYLTPYNRK